MKVLRPSPPDHQEIDLTCPELAAIDVLENTDRWFCERLIAELRELIERV